MIEQLLDTLICIWVLLTLIDHHDAVNNQYLSIRYVKGMAVLTILQYICWAVVPLLFIYQVWS